MLLFFAFSDKQLGEDDDPGTPTFAESGIIQSLPLEPAAVLIPDIVHVSPVAPAPASASEGEPASEPKVQMRVKTVS